MAHASVAKLVAPHAPVAKLVAPHAPVTKLVAPHAPVAKLVAPHAPAVVFILHYYTKIGLVDLFACACACAPKAHLVQLFAIMDLKQKHDKQTLSALDERIGAGKVNPSCCLLLPPAPPYYPFPRVKIHTRGNIWSFLWAGVNAATPLGTWGRSVTSLGGESQINLNKPVIHKPWIIIQWATYIYLLVAPTIVQFVWGENIMQIISISKMISPHTNFSEQPYYIYWVAKLVYKRFFGTQFFQFFFWNFNKK